jgi:hypothetical protein
MQRELGIRESKWTTATRCVTGCTGGVPFVMFEKQLAHIQITGAENIRELIKDLQFALAQRRER